ncbi:transposase family protein [Streptomyces sp. NPDC047028]|uniref:transposase family protein n=1 Tax=Streptomyces sp. NPDC047028 TaxID=3155793 RepID=UPI0033D8274F
MSRCRQAQLALSHLRKNETLAQLSAALGVSETRAWSYVDETVRRPRRLGSQDGNRP